MKYLLASILFLSLFSVELFDLICDTQNTEHVLFELTLEGEPEGEHKTDDVEKDEIKIDVKKTHDFGNSQLVNSSSLSQGLKLVSSAHVEINSPPPEF